MRQAQDSEIIRLSMDIREHRPIPFFSGNEVMVIPREEVTIGMMKWADQILTATNATRNDMNNKIRQYDGRGREPEVGDKVISLSNHWDIQDSSGESYLINGTIGYLNGIVSKENVNYPVYFARNFPRNIPICKSQFVSEIGENYGLLNIDYTDLTTGKPFLTSEQEYILYGVYKRNEKCPQLPLSFNYGYAITTHRAQGSEWDKILTIEEGFPFNAEDHTRWLYTAVTRGVSKLVLAR